jgi:DNA-directed RNA polymerase subunit beta
MLTIKSDDVTGRSAAFDAIIKGRNITQSNTPASFNVLVNYLRGLSLDVSLGERSFTDVTINEEEDLGLKAKDKQEQKEESLSEDNNNA